MRNRREFVRALGAAGLAGAGMMVAGCRAASARRRLGPICAQTYTMRFRLEEDFEGSLARAAEIGYEEIEFDSYFGHSPEQVRQVLQRTGLRAPAAHRPFVTLESEWPATVEYAEAAGHQYIVLAWVAAEHRTTLDDYRRIAETCNRVGELAKAAGLTFAYHNHDFEFEAMDGRVPWDILAEETDQDLVRFELDLYWIAKAGGDASTRFTEYPGRFPLVHVKDMAPDRSMADVGAGTIDFAAVFAQSETAGIRHYVVEHDNPGDPFASLANSYRYLRSLEF
jgi:sugar phosphate isomerase/epimerase